MKEKLPIPETRSNPTESLPCIESTTNDENTPFKCNYCDATSSVITSLQIHMKIAHKWEIRNTESTKGKVQQESISNPAQSHFQSHIPYHKL